MRMSERIESLHKILVGEADKYADLYIKFLRLKEQNAELLKALRRITAEYEMVMLSEFETYRNRLPYENEEAWKVAKAAIAKATDGE